MDGPEPDFLPLVTLLHEGFPDGSVSKEPLSKAGATGDMGSILGSGRLLRHPQSRLSEEEMATYSSILA